MNPLVIKAIVAMMEREGGIQNVSFCGDLTSWHDSICGEFLWYNVDIGNPFGPTTRVIRL